MEQRHAEDTKNLWRILVVVVITGALLFWVMNMGEGDPAPVPGTPPPPGVGVETAPDEVEALDNGPLHRPPGTAPADIRRPASAPYDDFEPHERRPDSDDAEEEPSGDDGSDPRSEDERPSTRPVPPGFRKPDGDEDADDAEQRAHVSDVIRSRDDIQSARNESVSPKTRDNIQSAAETFDDVNSDVVEGVLDDLELSDADRRRLGDDPEFADELLDEYALSDREREVIRRELAASPHDEGDAMPGDEASHEPAAHPDEGYDYGSRDSGEDRIAEPSPREPDRDVASDGGGASAGSTAGSSRGDTSPEHESEYAYEDDYGDEYADAPASSVALEEYSETLDEAHYVDDPVLYSTIATQGLAEALYLMSAGRTLSEDEAARQRDELLDRTHDTTGEHTDGAETDRTNDDAQDGDTDAADDEEEWTVWVDAVDWLRHIQQEDYPELATMVDDVEEAAEALDPELPEEEQADELAEFFELIELAIEAMAIEDEQFWDG